MNNQENNIDSLLNSLSNDLDNLGYITQELVDTYIEYVRELNPDCADDMEIAFFNIIMEQRFGIGSSIYTKTMVIRPIQRKYRDTENHD